MPVQNHRSLDIVSYHLELWRVLHLQAVSLSLFPKADLGLSLPPLIVLTGPLPLR